MKWTDAEQQVVADVVRAWWPDDGKERQEVTRNLVGAVLRALAPFMRAHAYELVERDLRERLGPHHVDIRLRREAVHAEGLIIVTGTSLREAADRAPGRQP